MLIDVLRQRRSIRQYQQKAVEQDKIDILVESVLRSPSSRGLNPWEFIVVKNTETLAELAKSKAHGSSFLKGAPLAIVVCADPTKSDIWVEDTAIASLILHLSAADLGLGSCWIQIRNRPHDEQSSSEAFVVKTLGIKPGIVVEAIIAIGYPAEKVEGRDSSSLLYERVSYEEYGKKQ